MSQYALCIQLGRGATAHESTTASAFALPGHGSPPKSAARKGTLQRDRPTHCRRTAASVPGAWHSSVAWYASQASGPRAARGRPHDAKVTARTTSPGLAQRSASTGGEASRSRWRRLLPCTSAQTSASMPGRASADAAGRARGGACLGRKHASQNVSLSAARRW